MANEMVNEKSKARFVVTFPLKTEIYEEHIMEKKFKIATHIQNSLVRMMKKNINRLKQDKVYRHWLTQKKSKERTKNLNERREMHGVTKSWLEDTVKDMQKHFLYSTLTPKGNPTKKPHLSSQECQKIVERVWTAVEKTLFGTGKRMHFKKHGQVRSIEGKSDTNGVKVDIEKMTIEWNGLTLPFKVHHKDKYAQTALMTCPIQYSRVIRQKVRGKMRYYVQIVFAGIPPKTPKIGKGKVGIDIGISTIATVGEEDIQLEEFCAELESIAKELKFFQRKMNRSRRKTNPNKYNQDKTIKKGNREPWVRSKNYLKLLSRVQELHRRQEAIRKQAHEKHANRILKQGDEFYDEKMNYKGLKKTWFGKQIGLKAPSKFLGILKRKLGYHGKELYEVNTWKVKASQYDIHRGDYRKKPLRVRIHETGAGDVVQRDIYSAFLLKHTNEALDGIEREKALLNYQCFMKNYQIFLEKFQQKKENGMNILASMGI